MADRALHICLVSQSYLPFHGGITEHVWHLAASLAARGHRVCILTGTPLCNGHQPEPDPPNVRVLRVGRTIRVPSNGGRACITLGGRWSSKLSRLLPEAPDVVHIHSPLEPFLPLWAIRRFPGVKIGTFHTGGEKPHWGYRGLATWLRPFARRLARRLAVSQVAAHYVSRHFPGHYEVIPNGIDLSRFRPRRESSGARSTGQTHFLYAGRLDPRKGLHTLLDAFDRLHCSGAGQVVPTRHGRPDPRLTIVGDGPERVGLERFVADRRLPVTFLGAVDRRELPHYYQEADVFVAPSVDGESFGISLLEAMASGLPIVASDIPGYRETMMGAEAAVYFPPGSASALKHHLGVLLGDAPRRRRMGSNGHAYVRRYAWPNIAEEIEQVYRDALKAIPSAVQGIDPREPAEGERFVHLLNDPG